MKKDKYDVSLIKNIEMSHTLIYLLIFYTNVQLFYIQICRKLKRIYNIIKISQTKLSLNN